MSSCRATNGNPCARCDEPAVDLVLIAGFDEPLHPEHVRSAVEQCREAGVPCVFAGWGEWVPWEHMPPGTQFDVNDSCGSGIPDDETSWYRVGAARSGALLDGKTLDELPKWIAKEV